MKQCIRCEEFAVNPEDPPRYDVLNPDYNPEEDIASVGPYCPECWPLTFTGAPSA